MDRQSSSSTGMEGPFRFLPDEVKEMEERLFPVTGRRLDHILMDELAVKFSYFRGLAGMTPVKTKQVLNWFHNNRNKHCPKIAREEHAPVSTREFWANHQQPRGSSLSKLKPTTGTRHAGSSSGNNCIDGHTKYEAKSGRDGAWYDVQDFVAQRFCESGDLVRKSNFDDFVDKRKEETLRLNAVVSLGRKSRRLASFNLCGSVSALYVELMPKIKISQRELLAHFSGFGGEEAEWINARTCLRQCSVPYKATECANVHCRDPVLCYKVSEQSGLYFDAEVHAIERKTHDSGEECDCKILVVYVHDNSEDIVSLKKLCRRYVGDNYKPQTLYERGKE